MTWSEEDRKFMRAALDEAGLAAQANEVPVGAYDPKSGAAGSVIDLADDRRLNHQIEVNGGLLEEQCAGLLKKFFESRRS